MADPKENEEAETVETEEETGSEENNEDTGGEEETGAEIEAEGESEQEAAAGEAQEGTEETEVKPQTRGEKRIAALNKRLKEEEERRIKAETLAEERARQPQAHVDPEVQRRNREEKLATMTPEERSQFLADEKLDGMQRQVLLTQLRTADMLDKERYDRKTETNKVYAKHAAEVERRLYAERQQGRDYPREKILAVIVGEQALNAKPDMKKQDAARRRVDEATGRPLSGRTNPAPQRSGRKNESLEELEARIGNVSFPDDMRF